MKQNRKIILFGGSFDPIHQGHVRVAQHAMKELNAEKIIFVPARRSPHKDTLPTAGHHRVAMIQEAITGIEGFSVSDCELSRPEPSYTLETIHFFNDAFPDAVIHWLIGADQLAELDRWYRIDELLAACTVSVMYRAGFPPPDFGRFTESFSSEVVEKLKNAVIRTPLIDISSTDIRKTLAKGKIPCDVLCPAVLDYIRDHHLYGCS